MYFIQTFRSGVSWKTGATKQMFWLPNAAKSLMDCVSQRLAFPQYVPDSCVISAFYRTPHGLWLLLPTFQWRRRRKMLPWIEALARLVCFRRSPVLQIWWRFFWILWDIMLTWESVSRFHIFGTLHHTNPPFLPEFVVLRLLAPLPTVVMSECNEWHTNNFS